MRLGHGHRRSVVILWLWTGLLSVFVLYPVYTGKGDAMVPVAVGALALVLLTFFHPGLRRRRAAEALERELAEGDATGATDGGSPAGTGPAGEVGGATLDDHWTEAPDPDGA